MEKIRFWKWQHTDELGLPSLTRFRISDGDRETAGDAWSQLETTIPKKSPTGTRDVQPK
jgi:hypothetical protein